MLRIFVSFYLFIVIALVGLSAALDRLMLDQEPESDYLSMVGHMIATVNSQAVFQEWSKHDAIDAQLVTESELSFSDNQRTLLQEQGFLIAYGEHDHVYIYSQFSPNQLVRARLTIDNTSNQKLLWYHIVFFTALACLVALWSWPLWRDVKTLEQGVALLQADGSIKPIELGASSNLQVVAKALNTLSDRVKSLLNDQRELTGAVAHEFRTPLARLKFALESLPQGSKKNSMSEDLAELDALIREMLEFSESVHHQPELSIAEIAVAELVAKLIDRLPSSLRQGIDIHNRCENVILQADGHFVERAVLNLITNSLKYAESKIDIRTVQQQGALLIVVEDDGSGVPESLRDKVFDPFYRPDKSRTRHQGGAGLGLATVKRIQQWHQGDCWVEKSTMGGAKFILSYPHINMADK